MWQIIMILIFRILLIIRTIDFNVYIYSCWSTMLGKNIIVVLKCYVVIANMCLLNFLHVCYLCVFCSIDINICVCVCALLTLCLFVKYILWADLCPNTYYVYSCCLFIFVWWVFDCVNGKRCKYNRICKM